MLGDDISIEIRDEGKYWTPDAWARFARTQAAYKIAPFWQDDYIVYDPCCGGGALLKNEKIKYKIETTLKGEDVDLMGGALYEGNHIRMRHDFLNVLDVPDPVDELLSTVDKPILFFMNPPYVTPGKSDQGLNNSQRDVSNTFMRAFMPESLTFASKQLYIQFLWRCVQIAEQHDKSYAICMFSSVSYLMRPSFQKFRDWFFGKVSFEGGFCFPSTDFDNINTPWPVAVSYFKESEIKTNPHKFNFGFYTKSNLGVIAGQGEKVIYNLPKEKKAMTWALPYQKANKNKVPGLRTGIAHTEDKPGTMHPTAICNIAGVSFMPQYKNRIYLISSGGAANYGFDVYEKSFLKMAAAYAAIRICKNTWINDKDEMKIPTAPQQELRAWQINALVCAVFDIQNNCSSICFDMELGKFKTNNHLFWKSKFYMSDHFPGLRDYSKKDYSLTNAGYLHDGTQPLAAEILKTNRGVLWEEAVTVLELADRLLHECIGARLPNPVVQWHRWDAGFYQLRKIWYMFPTYEEEFRPAYRKLKARLRREMATIGFWSQYDWAHQYS